MDFQFLINLSVAVLLGAMIGLERQWRQRMAGLRTNTLVSAGSALFALLSQEVMTGGDHSRIAAQVVSGVGFLGAGVIMRDGLTIRGLNTAATLWCSSAVGLLAGFGSPYKAAIGAFAILGTNILLRPIANKINLHPNDAATEKEYHFQIRFICRDIDENHIRALTLQALTSSGLMLRSIHSENQKDSVQVEVIARIECATKNNALIEQIVGRLSLEKGVTAASWSFDEVPVA